MADTREYVNKFANANGGDIFVEDAKLGESTAVTDLGSNAIVLKGTDGSFHEIDKTSFTSAVRSVIGTMIKNLDKGTSIQGVAAIGANASGVNADDLGMISPANLASVLGALMQVPKISITTSKTDGWEDLNIPANIRSFLIIITTYYESCIISVTRNGASVVKVGGTTSIYQASWKASESDPTTSSEVYCFTYTNNQWRILLGISNSAITYSIHVLY